jgi:DNA-directed RNA polymerase specialized sigma24 family protein
VLSLPVGTVKILLHRGRIELKKQVLRELGETRRGEK